MTHNENNIPKLIHYCWFGGNPLPELALKCIESWKKYCPDYEIKEWNESNFNIDSCDYVKEAYEAKKWAFVSDYARFWILYHEGGLYFDTDVEIIKPIEDIIQKGPFMGGEPTENADTEMKVAPGLGLAVNKGNKFYKDILDFYNKRHFLLENGENDVTTIVEYTTDLLVEKGFSSKQEIQLVEGIYIYPPEFFCPMNYITGEIFITENTRSIHHYSESWHNSAEKMMTKISRKFSKSGKIGKVIEKTLIYPLKIWNKVQKIGLKQTISFVWNKFRKI